MCLVAIAWQAHDNYPLVLIANRDESYQRPSHPAHWWESEPRILAGRDLEAGGTWLAARGDGRWAAVTNYREPRSANPKPTRRSRGHLPYDFVTGTQTAAQHLQQLADRRGDYAGFNLLAFDGTELWWYSNRGGRATPVTPGVHALSNHLLNTPWPKVDWIRNQLGKRLRENLAPETLFELLAQRSQPPGQLPDTGVGERLEQELAPVFIAGTRYGSRASTVMLMDVDKNVRFIEQNFGPGGRVEQRHEFHWCAAQTQEASLDR